MSQVCRISGVTLEFDPSLVIPNKSLSIAEGAIRPWSKMNSDRHARSRDRCSILRECAKREKFSLDTPLKKLSAKHFDVYSFGEKRDKENRFPGSDRAPWSRSTEIPSLITCEPKSKPI
jgi:excinuclease ABC subunit A